MPPPAYATTIQDAGSFASMESRKTHRQSRKTKPSAHEQAVILSTATNQATAAAKSIFMSGGNQDTALSTARAAAEAVLLPRSTELAPMFSSKRQLKQQAHVVASMALLAAQASTNSFGDGSSTNPPSVAGSRKNPPSVIQSSARSLNIGPLASFTTSADEDSAAKTHTRQTPAAPLSLSQRPPQHQNQPSQRVSQILQQHKRTPLHGMSPRRGQGETFLNRKQAQAQESQYGVHADVDVDGRGDEPAFTGPSILVGESSQSYDTEEENCDSVDFTDDDASIGNSASSDAFENVETGQNEKDKEGQKQQDKSKETAALSFGSMFCGGGLACSPAHGKAEERDDMSGDNRSQYSRHSEEFSHHGKDQIDTPVARSKASKWRGTARKPMTPKRKTPKSRVTPKKSRKNSDSEGKQDDVEASVFFSKTEDALLQRKIKDSKSRNSTKKPDKKRKESMEKLVLRAMAADDLMFDDNQSICFSTGEKSSRTASSKNTSGGASRASRLSRWMRRKIKL